MRNIDNAFTLWITGLPASGKTTLANSIKKVLVKNGIITIVLDGDYVRKTVNKDLAFQLNDREENNRRVAEIARMLNNAGINVICSLITPTNKIRKKVGKIIGKENFAIIYLNTPINICESRDKKQLYQKARQGNVTDFTGISSIFEEPKSPDITLNGENSLTENSKQIITFLSCKYHLGIVN